MTDFPDVKLKALVTFPATVNGGTGIDATKANGAVTVNLAFNEFSTSTSLPVSSTSNFLVYDTALNSYRMMPASLFGGGSSGISDAPVDGTRYSRQSSAWSAVFPATLSGTTAAQNFNYGSFGGHFTSSKAEQVYAIDQPATDASVGPRFTMAITSEVAGGHTNGPADQRSPLWLFSGKKSWLTTPNDGEVDGAYMLVQQGNLGDGGGLLIGANKVFAGGGTGGLVAVETSTARVNTSGTTTDMIESIVGLQEGAGGALNSGGASFYAESKTGTSGVGLAIVNDTSAFSYAIAAFTSRNPANGYFSVQYDGTTVVRLGSASSHISLRYASNAFFIRDETNATNLVGVTKTGVLSSSAGVTPATGSSTITRALRVKASVTFGTIAAQSSAIVDVSVPGCIVDDMVHVNMTANYASDSEIVTGRVLSNGTVRLSANNNSNTPLVTSAQDAIICVFGMT